MHDQTTTDELDDGALPAVRPQTLPPVRDPGYMLLALAAYNAGTLHGAWIVVTDASEIWKAVKAVLAASPEPFAEEWRFTTMRVLKTQKFPNMRAMIVSARLLSLFQSTEV